MRICGGRCVTEAATSCLEGLDGSQVVSGGSPSPRQLEMGAQGKGDVGQPTGALPEVQTEPAAASLGGRLREDTARLALSLGPGGF